MHSGECARWPVMYFLTGSTFSTLRRHWGSAVAVQAAGLLSSCGRRPEEPYSLFPQYRRYPGETMSRTWLPGDGPHHFNGHGHYQLLSCTPTGKLGQTAISSSHPVDEVRTRGPFRRFRRRLMTSSTDGDSTERDGSSTHATMRATL